MTDRLTAGPAERPLPIALELAGWIGILAVAAALRLPDLAGRGAWDADQGHDMLVLRNLVLDGRIPLLGPPTSIGAFHHGVLYYALLAPAAFVSGADPVAVTAWIALGGIVAVATTGWLARSIAGPWAGLVAGLILAVSASAVEESVFIWNPNLIALSSSIALAAAWRAHRTGRARWWVVAGAAAVVTMHCHVLGVILTPVVAGLMVGDWWASRRRANATGGDAARIAWAGLAWIGLAALSYVPLAIHELSDDASELRAAMAFVAGGGGSTSVGLPIRLAIVLVRVLSWPLAGLLSKAPIAALAAAGLVIAVVIWRGWLRPSGDDEVSGTRWLGLGLAWTVVALAIAAPSLATIVPGLPNDHYHAFADPMVVALVGIGAVALLRARVAASRAAGVAGLIAIVAFNAVTQPPAVAADGGWRAAEAAAQRVLGAAGDRSLLLDGLPSFKSTEALEFPLERSRPGVVVPGGIQGGPAETRDLVILCDDLFRESIGLPCGGPAEEARIASEVGPRGSPLKDRFEAAPGRWISIYKFSPTR